jgi:hypothetical protein
LEETTTLPFESVSEYFASGWLLALASISCLTSSTN